MTQTVLLGDEIELAYGKGLPQRVRVPGKYPVYGSNGQVDTHHEPLLQGPGIVVGRKGSVGEVIWSDKDFWPIDTTYYVKLKNPENSLKYWYYQLKVLGLNKLNSHSAIPGLNRDVAYAKTVIKRTPDEQKKIADILGSIDEKIELNRQMNETLEQMGQALFRHYFIDNTEAETWDEVAITNLINFIGGSQPPKSEHIYEAKEGYVRFIQNRDYSSSNHKTYIPVSKRNKLCSETDIMMDKYGEAGKVRFGIDGAYNVALAKIVPRKENMQEYLRSYFSMPQIQRSLEAAAAASTRSSLNATTFAGLKIKMPSNELLARFEEEQKNALKMIIANNEEIQTLTTLRDTLLPRLINGKMGI